MHFKLFNANYKIQADITSQFIVIVQFAIVMFGISSFSNRFIVLFSGSPQEGCCQGCLGWTANCVFILVIPIKTAKKEILLSFSYLHSKWFLYCHNVCPNIKPSMSIRIWAKKMGILELGGLVVEY